MKKWLLLAGFLVTNIAQANTTANLAISSGYIWRGLSFSTYGNGATAAQNAPVVQGSFDMQAQAVLD